MSSNTEYVNDESLAAHGIHTSSHRQAPIAYSTGDEVAHNGGSTSVSNTRKVCVLSSLFGSLFVDWDGTWLREKSWDQMDGGGLGRAVGVTRYA